MRPRLSHGAIPGATGVWGHPPLPHTRMGYVGGLEALELFILLKPCYEQHPWKLFIYIDLFEGRMSEG